MVEHKSATRRMAAQRARMAASRLEWWRPGDGREALQRYLKELDDATDYLTDTIAREIVKRKVFKND
jgi:hypothetical protein